MDKKNIYNAGWIVGCKIIKAFLTLVITMLTARYLGPSNYGLINYAASLVLFATPIMQLGFNSTLVYEIINNRKNEGKILGTAIGFNCIAASFCILGIVTFVFFANAGEKETLLVCFLYSFLLLFQAVEMIQYWFQAKLKSKYCAIAMLVSYMIVAIIQIIFLVTKKNIYFFAISYSIDYFIIAVILYVVYQKIGNNKLEFSFNMGKRLFEKSKYYIVSSIMITLFAQTDKIMLKLMIGNEVVGYYSAAINCATMFSFVFAAILDSFRPSIFEAKNKSQEAYKNSMIELYSILIYLSLAICILTVIFAPIIIKIVYGNKYIISINPLRLIVWYTTFSYLGSARNIWIIAENKQKYLWIINSSGALTNIIINYMLIPNYGIMGAAFASLVTQVFTNVIIGFIMEPIRENNGLLIKSININVIKNIIKNLITTR